MGQQLPGAGKLGPCRTAEPGRTATPIPVPARSSPIMHAGPALTEPNEERAHLFLRAEEHHHSALLSPTRPPHRPPKPRPKAAPADELPARSTSRSSSGPGPRCPCGAWALSWRWAAPRPFARPGRARRPGAAGWRRRRDGASLARPCRPPASPDQGALGAHCPCGS